MYEDEGWNARVDVQWGKPFFHFTCSKWSHTMYKDLLGKFLEVCDQLKEMGFTDVYSFIPNGDKKLLKFQTMFCLEPVSASDKYILCKRSL